LGETVARINIEDEFWVEIMPLARKLKSEDVAIGQVMRFWRLIQEKHKHGKFLSEEDFRAHDFSEHLLDYFAVRSESGVTARGASKHFSWLKERTEAGIIGGSRGTEAKKTAAKNREQAKRQNHKQPQATTSKQQKAQPSYSSSSSPSSSDSRSCRVANSPDESVDPPTIVSILNVLRTKLHNEVHGVDPIKGAQVNGMLANFVKEVGEKEAPAVLELFYRKPKSFYKTRGHDIKLLLADKAALLTETRRQSPITPDAREASFNSALTGMARQEEIEKYFERQK
jgi:hypothetical protein